jgi:hypothetical protein
VNSQTPEGELYDIHLIGIPLEIHRQAREHQDALQREFALIASQADSSPDIVPSRLLDLVRNLSSRFQSLTTEQDAELRNALESGGESVDLHYQLPEETSAACIELAGLLREADEYCEAGNELLTLAAPPAVVAYREWFLGEFVRQIAGEDPLSWEDANRPDA